MIRVNPDPYTDEINDTDLSRQPMDNRITAHNLETGCTDLHFLNDVIQKITQLHNRIDRSNRDTKEANLTNISKRLYHKKYTTICKEIFAWSLK